MYYSGNWRIRMINNAKTLCGCLCVYCLLYYLYFCFICSSLLQRFISIMLHRRIASLLHFSFLYRCIALSLSLYSIVKLCDLPSEFSTFPHSFSYQMTSNTNNNMVQNKFYQSRLIKLGKVGIFRVEIAMENKT